MYIHNRTAYKGLGKVADSTKDVMRVLRRKDGTPYAEEKKKKETEETAKLKEEFLEALRSSRKNAEDMEPQMHSHLSAMECGFQNGQCVEPQDLWIIGHILRIRIRCSMTEPTCDAERARPGPNLVQLFPDAIYGPSSCPIELHVSYSPAFDDEGQRIAKYDLVFRDASGSLLLSKTEDVMYHQEGSFSFHHAQTENPSDCTQVVPWCSSTAGASGHQDQQILEGGNLHMPGYIHLCTYIHNNNVHTS